ncbi:MAG: TIGR03619 family F420-dependent LLM class oxidoreductase [Deltaproteobacteria bacterium]|nr:TIGR03619 family F420-dependent LLM class oxidoreductase [Deltaproteobacteria bacterium]
MRFHYLESMTNPSFYIPLVQAAEEAGWDGFAVPDSVCYPEVSDTKYPYTDDGNREFLDGKPFLEPFSIIPALAAVTTRMRFATFVMKLAIRNPVLAAKSATSVAVLSDNRFVFGVGLSPWPEDFEVCGAQWKGRGKRLDEMIEIIRGLSTGEYYSFKGEYYDIPSIKMSPVPTQPLPIMIGGHSEPALRRAARVGDGWMHAGGDAEELERMLGRLNELRREYGREKEPFELHVISLDAYTAEGVKRLEDAGVTDVYVGFRADAYAPGLDPQPIEEKLAALRGYADEVISKVRS